MKEILIGNKKIGGENPVFIIAELSANHLQDYDLAVKTIEAAKDVGADAIKLQTYTPDTITLDSDKDYFKIKQGTVWDGKTLYQLYNEAYTPWDWQPKLKSLADNLGLIFLSSPFDKTAVDFLEDIDVPAYKIASFEITDLPLIEYVASKGKPLIISTGIAKLSEIEEAIDVCKKTGNDQIILLKCTSSYPTPLEDVNLKTMVDLSKKFDCPVGLSDHTLGITVPIAAAALSACIIEKHLILNRDLGGPDSSFSLEVEEFRETIQAVRNVEKALGEITYELSNKTKNNRKFSRSLFIVKDIKAGEVFSDDNVKSIRPSNGLPPKMIHQIIGKKAVRDCEKGTPLSMDLLVGE